MKLSVIAISQRTTKETQRTTENYYKHNKIIVIILVLFPYFILCQNKHNKEHKSVKINKFDISAGLGIRYISSNSIGKKYDFFSECEYPYGKTYNTGSNCFPSITGVFD